MGSTLDRDQGLYRHVNDMLPTLEEKFAAAEAVDALLVHPGWAHISRILNAEVERIDARLDAGVEPPSRAGYALAHGRRGGLLGAEHAARAILEVAAKAHEEQRRKHERDAEPSPEGVR